MKRRSPLPGVPFPSGRRILGCVLALCTAPALSQTRGGGEPRRAAVAIAAAVTVLDGSGNTLGERDVTPSPVVGGKMSLGF